LRQLQRQTTDVDGRLARLCKLIEAGSAWLQRGRATAVSHDGLMKSQYSGVREYQACKASLAVKSAYSDN
jgi:hypothetical protein